MNISICTINSVLSRARTTAHLAAPAVGDKVQGKNEPGDLQAQRRASSALSHEDTFINNFFS